MERETERHMYVYISAMYHYNIHDKDPNVCRVGTTSCAASAHVARKVMT